MRALAQCILLLVQAAVVVLPVHIPPSLHVVRVKWLLM
jgi:hypothetical protein